MVALSFELVCRCCILLPAFCYFRPRSSVLGVEIPPPYSVCLSQLYYHTLYSKPPFISHCAPFPPPSVTQESVDIAANAPSRGVWPPSSVGFPSSPVSSEGVCAP
ncbi:hypothetical protein M440DRAFT_1401504 [Trichoderma longibrachiatum ATCC 18648]|uniref:Uncharacterized protein n=1 Tax=Trichoderma longibrachiatum ATCC 18648 TaxID=983965 RepID=A0A2T4C395_TRILO|nr:hypothetical protein M440DRAFT_1401504 [Trichoderma longibrachiatum ATCC 18648]